MKVKFKPYVLDILKKCNSTYTFRLGDGKNITYFKEFTKYEYFEVIKVNDEYYYKVSSPRNISMFFLHKDHVIQTDLIGLDDELFEWSE